MHNVHSDLTCFHHDKVCAPVVVVWLNATTILLASGQDPDIADQVNITRQNKTQHNIT
jgi:hypothetical protein